ncbi:MAG: four helix bundle protein [Chitinophagaceae bacterium]|nr:MAG: four helix bundle protein [Chitinophagaceae bacterium]
MEKQAFNLEERLIRFGVAMIRIAEKLPKTYAGNHMSGQLTRSGTAPALQYGEAQAAESRADFVHKMKVGLKELKETFINLRMVRLLEWIKAEDLEPELKETLELIRIFVSSINTARTNGATAPRP